MYKDGAFDILRTTHSYPASGETAAAASLFSLLLHIRGTGELGERNTSICFFCASRECAHLVEHQGHWSVIIPPLVSISLLCKIFMLSNVFQIHFSAKKRNEGSSVLLLVFIF